MIQTIKNLGSCVEVYDSLRRPVAKRDRVAGPFPYYGASGVVDYTDDYIFEVPHLLVAEDGENLRTRKLPIAFLADGKFWVNNHAHVLRGNAENDTRFLCYLLQSMDISGFITGSTQPKLNQRALLSIPIEVPSLTEQRSIAATLGTLDGKIESNLRLISTILEIIDSLSELFGEKLQLVPLNSIACPVKQSINPTRLGDAPVDHFSLPAFDEGGRPERVSASTIRSSKLLVPRNAILISRLNPRIERIWWASTDSRVQGLASTEFLILTAERELELAATWLAVRSSAFREELPQRVTGTSGSHQRVRPDDALSIEVPDFIKAPEQLKQTVLALLRKTDTLRVENERLEELRGVLLPGLMSGRIRVPVEEVSK